MVNIGETVPYSYTSTIKRITDDTALYRHRIRNSSRARYLSFTEAPHNIEYLRVSGGEFFFKPRDFRLSKQATLICTMTPALAVLG